MKLFFRLSMIALLVCGVFVHAFERNEPSANNTDLVIFSYDRPMQLYALLESIDEYVTGLATVSVIYRTSSEEFALGYNQVMEHFDNVRYMPQGQDPRFDFKELTLQAVAESSGDYILFAVDDDIVTDDVDLNACIESMATHDAYAFYLRLGANLTECYTMNAPQAVPPLAEVNPQTYAWFFYTGHHDWGYPHTVDLTLYRKSDVVPFLQSAHYYSPNTLEGLWANDARSVMHKHGLCYEHTKMVNLPLNRVQNDCQNAHMNFMTSLELLELFNQGFKIDIQPLHRIENKSAHMNYEPILIQR